MSESTMEVKPVVPSPLSLSDSAIKRIALLKERKGKPDLMLRVTVAGGGCSGFQYSFDFDETLNDDDSVIEKNGVAVVIDSMSLVYLFGSEIDFVEDLIGSSFAMRNPNATASCSCGASFAVG
jgi:iron-sulfur cluster insertion protein